MDTKKLQLNFFIGLLLAVFALALALFYPFIAPIALAFMAAVVIRPVHKWVLKEVKGRKTLGAILTVIIAMIVLLVPAAVLIQQVTSEAINFYQDVRDGELGTFGTVTESVVGPIEAFFPGFDIDVAGAVRALADKVVSNASAIFSSTASIALGLFIAVVSLFYMLRDGHYFRKAIVELSPLTDSYDNVIIRKIEEAVGSVVRGSLFVALGQGVVATVGFFIFGVPHAILWGAVTAIAALLPGIGTAITIVPIALYLVASGSTGAAIGLCVWGAIAVGVVDNIVMPIVVGKGFKVHPLLVLVSVLGGLSLFGPIGIFLGPLVIALLAALVEIYKIIILDDQGKVKTQV